MTGKNPKYTQEFKQTLVNLYHSGKTYIQITTVLMTVKTDFRFLRQNLVFFGLCFILILFVYLSGIAPMCRTVFFTAAIISCGGYINDNADNIGA